MQKGTIARIMDKGYGFISVEGSEDDLFFHSNELSGVQFDELREGDEVVFEPGESPKGPQATNVQLASNAGADEDAEETEEAEETAQVTE